MDAQDVGVASDYIHIIRVQGIDPYFLAAYLKTRLGKEAIGLRKHGVATVSLNKADVLSLPVPRLPKNTQVAIRQHYRDLLVEWRADRFRDARQAYYAGRMRTVLEAIEAHLIQPDKPEAMVNA